MNKFNDKAELKLTEKDVREAIEMWIDRHVINSSINVEKISKTRSKEWFLIARLK